MSPSQPTDTALIDALRAALSPERVAEDPAARLIYSRDMWPRTLLDVRDQRPLVSPPDVIVWPESAKEVAAVVRLAASSGTPVVPWGAGSGVCGGAMALKGGIMVDLKRLNAVLDVNAVDLLASFGAGILGQALEDELNLHGLTLGHFPSSIHCSTLGGWIATRSAGQMSSRYGKIEDMVEGLEVVLGTGETIHCSSTDSPGALELFCGSEGTLGIVTRAELRVRRLARARSLRAYRFAALERGLEGMRRVMQSGILPAVLRLYDPLDSLIVLRERRDDAPGPLAGLLRALAPTRDGIGDTGQPLRSALTQAALERAGLLSGLARAALPRFGRGCVLIAGIEGEPELAEVDAAICHAELSAAGGEDLGPELGLRWYDERYAVAFKQSPLLAAGILADTLEVATTWDRLGELHEEVHRAIGKRAIVLAHFSHAYIEGCSIYFTFAISARAADARERYDAIWQEALGAAVKVGATISHHHGVGLSKANFMEDEHGPALALYRSAKRALDPQGILNPGKMGLDGLSARGAA